MTILKIVRWTGSRGTTPIHGDGARMTVVFDVIPEVRHKKRR